MLRIDEEGKGGEVHIYALFKESWLRVEFDGYWVTKIQRVVVMLGGLCHAVLCCGGVFLGRG